jgi:hypothetical protein
MLSSVRAPMGRHARFTALTVPMPLKQLRPVFWRRSNCAVRSFLTCFRKKTCDRLAKKRDKLPKRGLVPLLLRIDFNLLSVALWREAHGIALKSIIVRTIEVRSLELHTERRQLTRCQFCVAFRSFAIKVSHPASKPSPLAILETEQNSTRQTKPG